MRVLLDNNVHYRFGGLIQGHDVLHVQDIGWEQLRNGDLIDAAEREGFEVIVTGDKQMQHQQAISSRRISIMILNSLFLKWEYIAPLAPMINEALNHCSPGSFFIINREEPN
jgi:hypothetical protein